MGRGWTFRLPPLALDGQQADLARASLIGKDGLPWPTDVERDGGTLILRRAVHDPHSATIPFSIPDFGGVLIQTCALPEGGEYRLLLELARGEVDKAHTELAETERKGLRPSLALKQMIAHARSRLTAAVFTKD